MKRIFQRAEGFSLVETLIAMFLIAFIVGELGLVDVGNRRLAHIAKSITKANALADDAIEKSRNRKYSNLFQPITDLAESCFPAGVPPVTTTLYTCTSTSPLEGKFTRVRTIAPRDAGNAATTLGLSKKADIVATVTFTDSRGVEHRISVASVLSRY